MKSMDYYTKPTTFCEEGKIQKSKEQGAMSKVRFNNLNFATCYLLFDLCLTMAFFRKISAFLKRACNTGLQG